MSRYHNAASTNLYYKKASHKDTHTHTSSYNFYTQLPASNYLVAFIGTVRDNKMDESKEMDRSPCRHLKDQGYCISISCCSKHSLNKFYMSCGLSSDEQSKDCMNREKLGIWKEIANFILQNIDQSISK